MSRQSQINNFINNIVRAGRTSVPETIKFGEYFNRVIEDPRLSRTSGQRIYDMIMEEGTYYDKETGITKYHFFQNKIFGSDEAIEKIMEYFKASSMGMDIKKRVLLLLGPPGGGKSLFLQVLKDGLREYTRTDKGALYRVKGCPMNEDPLNLIEDQSARDDIWKKYNVKITGQPCPYCKYMLENDWHKNLAESVQVERFYIDEDLRQGVGTFAPSVNNDMTELYGDVDLRKVEEIGDSSNPLAYSFTGELHKANRGIMEFIEILKAEDDFLHVLLSLAEEEEFKTPRFSLTSVDETLIAHTNEGEFLNFIKKRENEAVIDRLFIVNMPYNLKPENEELIYHSAIQKNLVASRKSVHPGAIRFASEFVIMTRLEPKRDSDDGKDEIKNLRNGMFGLSPRFVLNAIALSLAKDEESTVGYASDPNEVSPTLLYKTMRDMIINYSSLTEDQRREYVKALDWFFERNKKRYYEFTLDDVRTKYLSKRGLGGLKLS